MTPLQIQMLLHFHCVAAPFEPWGPAHSEALEWFISEGVVDVMDGLDRPRLTARGEAYVKFLCDMPFPVAQWVLPKQEEK